MNSLSLEAVRQPDRIAEMTLQDSRTLAWSEWGPEAGQPVLYISGAGTSGEFAFGLDALEKLNIRLIAPDRPGLGRSDFDPDKTLLSVAGDFSELITRLSPAKIPVAAVSQGVPFALALAAMGPVSKLAIVSGQDELCQPEFLSGLPDQLRQMVEQAEADPTGLIAMLESFAEPESFLEFIVSTSSDLDKAFYSAEPFLSAFRRGLKAGFQQGPKGYALDTVAAMAPWTFEWGGISCPVSLWYGGQDVSPVHSPDGGAFLETRLQNATRYFFEDEGGSLLWTRAREILVDLVA